MDCALKNSTKSAALRMLRKFGILWLICMKVSSPSRNPSWMCLKIQLDKFKMKDGEGVAGMYSRLALITNEIAGLGSEEMTDKFIIKKILRDLMENMISCAH